MNEDVENTLSDIFPAEVVELIREIITDKNVEIDANSIANLIKLLQISSDSKPKFKDFIEKKVGFPLIDSFISKLRSPEKIKQNEDMFTNQEMDKIKKAFYRLYPGLNKKELNKKKTLLQLSTYLSEQNFSSGPNLFPELENYWNELASLDKKVITDLFSDTAKIKTHLAAFKGETIGLVFARELINSLPEIKEIFHNLRFKNIKNRKNVENYLLTPYQKLASYYEKVSKFALIDIKIVEGTFNPKRNYMSLLLHDIVSSFLKTENYKALGEVNITVRNSIAHSSYTFNEKTQTVRFRNVHTYEEHGYEELITMTKRLGVLLYVIMGHSNRGYSLEFQLLSEMSAEKEN